MSNSNSRKRAAPGAVPDVPMPQQMPPPLNGSQDPKDQLMRWVGGANSGTSDHNAYLNNSLDPNAGVQFDPLQVQAQLDTSSTPSNTLARRNMNTALVPSIPRTNFNASVEPWTGYNAEDGSLVHQTNDSVPEQDNIEFLEEQALKVKRGLQGKRRTIPPFVQKLSSFLEDSKHEDLIRWSAKGDSFIVMDEEEFAKTLIPELFKHKNYASFVRQLNMYGFHKRVGLSDNSMRASERRNKSPSEYSNPYFRRGHPNLLWLINKPKSGNKAKKGKGEADGDSDEDVPQEDYINGTPSSNVQPGRSLPPSNEQAVQRKEITVIRDELSKVREQQRLISNHINTLQRTNADLYNQALLFQTQHDRHQNSINAILNFLANVFRKTLEDQGNSQNVSEIISSMISSQGQGGVQPGSVVDLGDFFQNQTPASPSLGGAHKRTRGLLPPIPNQQTSARPPASRSSSVNSQYQHSSNQLPQMGTVTELFDGATGETPPNLRQELEDNPQERMMKIINDHNATNTTGMASSEAADLVANAPNTLDHDQRNKLVDFMAGQQSSSASPQPIPTGITPPVNAPQNSMSPTSPAMPMGDTPSPSAPPPSLSPIMRSPSMQPPSLNQINTNQMTLEQLQQLQREQDAKISELSERLGPLSPSGRIPSLEDMPDGFFDTANPDFDQYFDTNAFMNDTNLSDFDFNLDGAPDTRPPHPATLNDAGQGDDAQNDSPSRGKRRRVG